MTLILTFVSPWYVLQMSDRLISAATGSGTRSDPLGNKTVIYRASDGILTVGYTGTASIRGLTTDQWITEALTDTDLGQADFGVRITSGRLKARDVWASLQELKTQADRAAVDGHLRSGLEILAAGFQWKRSGTLRRPRPVVWHLGPVQQGPTRYGLKHLLRDQTKSEIHALGNVGGKGFPNTAFTRLRQSLDSNSADPAPAEDLILSAIREASAREDATTIGVDCMSVLIPRPSHPRVYVHYRPLVEARSEELSGGQFPQDLPAALSPFVATPGILACPLVIVGRTYSIRDDLFEIQLNAPDVPSDAVFGFTRQPPSRLQPRPRRAR
jgi:hypothetical protein